MKTFSIFCSLTVALAAFTLAETSPTPKSARNTAASSATPANEVSGTLVEFVAGKSVVINTGTQNERFKLSAQAQYFNPKGKQVPERKLKKDRTVRVHFSKQGDEKVADRITITRGGGGGHKKGKPKQSSSPKSQQ